MPQTRFVLKKALEFGHAVVVVVNKIDRPSARPEFVVNSTFELFIELNASDEQVFMRGCLCKIIKIYISQDLRACVCDMRINYVWMRQKRHGFRHSHLWALLCTHCSNLNCSSRRARRAVYSHQKSA